MSSGDGDGRGRTPEVHAEAELIANVIRQVQPYIETLPPGNAVRRDALTFIHRHSSRLGITVTEALNARRTLLDAKIEIDERHEERGLQPYSATISDRDYRFLAEGTALRLEELVIVSPQAAGRHIQIAERLPLKQVLAAQFGYGALCAALAERWRH